MRRTHADQAAGVFNTDDGVAVASEGLSHNPTNGSSNMSGSLEAIGTTFRVASKVKNLQGAASEEERNETHGTGSH